MTVEFFKEEYEKYKKENSLSSNIFKFKDSLLSSDSDDVLEYHFQLSSDLSINDGLRNMIQSFFYSTINNKRDKSRVETFLYNKFNETEADSEKSKLLRILGHLKSSLAHDLVLKEISSDNYGLRYSSIIVLGWVGLEKDLSVLNNQMLTDSSALLRCYCATAMRQIWFRLPQTKEEITKYIANAIVLENESEALDGMIITIQDLYQKKLGIKESRYGEASGDIEKAKAKTIKFLNNL